MRTLIPVLVLLACLMPTRAQAPPAAPPAVAPCTFRTLPVAVLDKNGEPVTGLTAADFRAEFRGNPVTVHSAEMHTRPMRVVILLDRSGSMRDTPGAWQLACQAVADLVTSAPPHVSLSLLVIGGAEGRSVVTGNDRTVILRMLAALQERSESASDRTAVLDALHAALDSIPSPHAGDLIYIVSDGADNSSRISFAQLEHAFLEKSVRAFAFLGPFPVALSSEVRPAEVAGPLQLAELTDKTGGAVFSLDPFTLHVTTSPAKLHSQMTQYYGLQIQLPMEVEKKRGWTLRLTRAKELGRPTLIYPRSLVPCPRPAAQP